MPPYTHVYVPPAGFRRLWLTVAWDGTGFAGWQSQPNAASVQDTLYTALAQLGGAALGGDTFRPVAAGRTDAGVHAEGMPLHWDIPEAFGVPPQRLARALNAHLPDSVGVLEAGPAPTGFHARFSCTGRHYIYRVLHASQRHPLWAGRALQVSGQLDTGAMNAAAALLVGTHDFAAFATQEDRQTVRELRQLRVQVTTGLAGTGLTGTRLISTEQAGQLLEIQVEGESFLRHMVRGLVGTLLLVGQGKLSVGAVQDILASRKRAQAGANVAACGLYFVGASYPTIYNFQHPSLQ